MLSEQHHRQLHMIAAYLPGISYEWEKEKMVHIFSVLADLLGYRMMWEESKGVCFCNHNDGFPRIFLEREQEQIQSVWLDIDTFRETDLLLKYSSGSDDKINELTIERLYKLDAAVRFLTVFWGPPAFYGEYWDSDFPRDQYMGIMMALWKMNNVNIALQVEHQKRNYPISLNMLITPEQELTSDQFDALVNQ